MPLNLLPDTFLSGTATDGMWLYRSLGTFWTQIFQDKQALQGYTIGVAEEVIQSYVTLAEHVQGLSVKDAPLYHRERWKPLIIRKSQYNAAPFKLGDTGAILGQQSLDSDYPNQLFRLGKPKVAGDTLFSFTPPKDLAFVGVLVDRLIAPTKAFIPEVDFSQKDGTFYFNFDLFETGLPKAHVVGDLGVIETFVDRYGRTVEDEFIVLWCSEAYVDQQRLLNSFGQVFELPLPTSEEYKKILGSLFNLAVEGPTLAALRSAFAVLAGAPIVLGEKEQIVLLYDNQHDERYVITDRNAYTLPIDSTLADNVKVGATLYAGECLTNAVKLTDVVEDPSWWNVASIGTKLALPSHLFLASVHGQLFFENTFKLLSYTGGNLTFPVSGHPKDVAAFQDTLNRVENRPDLLARLGFDPLKDATMLINPVDFLFRHLLKDNTALLKMVFTRQEKLSLFFDLLPNLRPYLPAHVYILTFLSLELSSEQIGGLNSSFVHPAYPGQILSVDGSDWKTGIRPGSYSDTDYYKNFKELMFCVSVNPLKGGTGLHTTSNLDTFTVNSIAGIKAGQLRTEIPSTVTIPGEEGPRLPSNREVPSLLFLDF